MHTHRIDSFFLRDNIKVEIVHESNPYFAGEPVSLVIRIRHLGSQHELSTINEIITGLEDEIEEQINVQETHEDQDIGNGDEDKPWIMKSLLKAFNANTEDGFNSADMEKKRMTIDMLNRQKKFHVPIGLISGYLQLSGVFCFDPEYVRESQLDSSSMKIGGIDASIDSVLEDGFVQSNDNADELSSFLNSKHVLFQNDKSGLFGEGNSLFGLGNASYVPDYKKSPILVIPQTLLFSELTLEPGTTKVFRFKTECLPADLPPTYNISKNISINYQLEFGVSKLEDDVKQYKVHVPINISPYVSEIGGQYRHKLNQKVIIMESGMVREILQRSSNQKRLSSGSIVTPNRRSSAMLNQERHGSAENIKRNFVQLIKSNQNGERDIEELVDLQMKMQFRDSEEELHSSNSTNDLSRNSSFSYLPRKQNTVADNISNLKENFFTQSHNTSDGINDGGKYLIPQISDPQRVYQINWNGQSITKLALSKFFYTTSDDLDLVLELDPSSPPLHKVSAVTISLEAFELINRNYAVDTTALSKPRGNHVYESRAICFDKCKSVPMKLVFPKTPMNQLPSQFITDIFQFKWMLVLKFVLVPRVENISLEQFYEDKKGVLFHAKETIEGEEFSCHIPVPILPSARNFGGW